MNIGVFGDSYALDNKGTWIDQLRSQGHHVGCFGAAGSSIAYSARILNQNPEFDILIWCLTTVGRFSFLDPITNQYIHAAADPSSLKEFFKNRPEISRQLDACIAYQKFIQDLIEEEFIYQNMIESMMMKHNNLMIVPCFNSPLYLGFSLFDITSLQTEDERTFLGHLTKANHDKLFALIKDNLKPGYFTPSLEHFKT